MIKSRWFLFLLVLPVLLAACAPTTTVVTRPTPVAAVLPASTVAVSAFPVTITDGAGNSVTIDSKPEKIISLTLGTDEILLDLVGPDRLIGVTYKAKDAATSNIAGRPELKQVANEIEADPEQIISLQPDLVFVATFTD